MLSLSTSNKKISKTIIFNIPAIHTCPFATGECKKSCYAMKAQRMYPNVRISRDRNFQFSLQDNFVSDMIEKIKSYNGKYKYFRIHESGDFYNQKYVDKWMEIAASFPDIKFLAYTKSYPYDYSNKPKNLTIRYSIWEDTKKINDTLPKAYMSDVKEAKGKTCKETCGDCRYCWDSPDDVIFIKH